MILIKDVSGIIAILFSIIKNGICSETIYEKLVKHIKNTSCIYFGGLLIENSCLIFGVCFGNLCRHVLDVY